ncbi:MAG TPA: serine hydrolase [Gemmatimonadales bacterium]|nr:serine hydrolase [Gemmatimonadales bacterium]
MASRHVHGNGGLLTTVEDLLTWNHALAAGRLGSPDVSKAMQTSGVFNDGRAVGYGGGLSLNPVRGVAAVSHTGSTAGYRAVLARFTDSDLHVAILCNRGDANPQALVLAMLDGLLPFSAAPQRRPVSPRNEIRVDPSLAADYSGLWFSDEVGGTVRTTVADGDLIVQPRPGRSWTLHMVATDSFTTTGGQRLVFARESGRRPGRLVISVERALGMEYVRVE